MGSEQNDGTSFTPTETKLCVNGCGFFGTASNMNLCSKCYRDLRVKEEQAASAKAAMEKTINLGSKIVSGGDFRSVTSSVEEYTAVAAVANESSSTVVESAGENPARPNLAKRCFSCNKKVGLTGFRCKCENMFCGAHRYPENHECSFDFKGAGRSIIAKANPVIKADKVDRI